MVAQPRGKERGKSTQVLTHSCHRHCWGQGPWLGWSRSCEDAWWYPGMVAHSQASWYVPKPAGMSPNTSAYPLTPWYVPKPTGIGPLPSSPYAQHLPHSLSPPLAGVGASPSFPSVLRNSLPAQLGPAGEAKLQGKLTSSSPACKHRTPPCHSWQEGTVPSRGMLGGRRVLCMGAALPTQMLLNPAFPGICSQRKLVCPLPTWPWGQGGLSLLTRMEEAPRTCALGLERVKGHHSVLA